MSFYLSDLSNIIKIKSNLDSRAAGMLTFLCNDYFILYLPYNGFAAANMAVREFKVVTIPAFVIDTVCCYITS